MEEESDKWNINGKFVLRYWGFGDEDPFDGMSPEELDELARIAAKLFKDIEDDLPRMFTANETKSELTLLDEIDRKVEEEGTAQAELMLNKLFNKES